MKRLEKPTPQFLYEALEDFYKYYKLDTDGITYNMVAKPFEYLHTIENVDVRDVYTEFLILLEIYNKRYYNLKAYTPATVLNILKKKACMNSSEPLDFKIFVDDFEYVINDDSIAIYYHETNELKMFENNDAGVKEVLNTMVLY